MGFFFAHPLCSSVDNKLVFSQHKFCAKIMQYGIKMSRMYICPPSRNLQTAGVATWLLPRAADFL